MKSEFVRYCRPKGSGFGNGARKRNLKEMWEMAMSFLNTYTDYELFTNAKIELWQCVGGYPQGLLDEMLKEFGEIEAPYKWDLGKKFNPDWAEFAFSNPKYECITLGPVLLNLPFKFKWQHQFCDPGESLDDAFDYFYKGDHGKFTIRFSDTIFFQSEFIIPYPIESESFKKIYDVLHTELPFKISTKSMIAFDRVVQKNGKTKFKAVGDYRSQT